MLTSVLGLNVPMEMLSSASFPLPSLGPILSKLARQVHNGKGFFVVRGLNPDDYSRETNVIMYVGMSSYIGETRGRQDEFGNMLRKSINNPFTSPTKLINHSSFN
jgi:hypothetical protein